LKSTFDHRSASTAEADFVFADALREEQLLGHFEVGDDCGATRGQDCHSSVESWGVLSGFSVALVEPADESLVSDPELVCDVRSGPHEATP